MARSLNSNLAHDPSTTPRSSQPTPGPRTRTGAPTPMPGIVDVLRSLDAAQDAASTSRVYADSQAARHTRKGMQVAYNRDQRDLRRDLRTSARGVGKNAPSATTARTALKSMPKPDANPAAWQKWSADHGQRVPQMRSAPTPPAATGFEKLAAKASVGHTVIAKANPVMMLTSGALAARSAYQVAMDAGASRTQAATAGAVAAAPMAGAAVAPSIIGRFAPAAAGTLARLALPLTALTAGVGAVRGGMAAYKDGKSAGGIAKESAIGAADALTFGLASKALNYAGADPTSLAIVEKARADEKAKQSAGLGKKPDAAATGRVPQKEEKVFDAANRRFEGQRDSLRPEEGTGKPPAYKDQWSDSRGRQYQRHDVSIRTAKENA